jgi:hypothetical protein
MGTCSHETAEFQVDYVQGKLEPEKRRLLEEHLASCPDCAEQVEALGWIRQTAGEHGPALFESHPLPERLVAFSEAPASVGREESASIRAHLELCRACSEEIQTLAEVDATLGHPVRRRSESPWWESIADLVRGWGSLSPVPAYAAILLMLVPTWVGLRTWLAPESTAPAPSGIRTVVDPVELRTDEERGAAGLATVVIRQGEEVTLVSDAPILEGGAVRYDARILGSQGELRWERNGMTSVDRFGTFLLFLDAHVLPPGDHVLLLEEQDLDRGVTRQTFRFPFRVETASP